jgi:hypothetical protein
MLDLLIDEVLELEGLDHVGLELRRQEGRSDLLVKELSHGTFELGGNGLYQKSAIAR